MAILNSQSNDHEQRERKEIQRSEQYAIEIGILVPPNEPENLRSAPLLLFNAGATASTLYHVVSTLFKCISRYYAFDVKRIQFAVKTNCPCYGIV